MKFTQNEAIEAFQKSDNEAQALLAARHIRAKLSFEEQSFVLGKLEEDNASVHSDLSKDLFQSKVVVKSNGNELTMSVETKMQSSHTAAASCKKIRDKVGELIKSLDPDKVIKEGGSGYAKIIAAVRYEFKQKDPIVVASHIYDETSAKWRDSLLAKAKHIQTRISEANTFPKDYEIDVAIVTSSPMVELREVLKLSGFVGEFHQQDVLHYFSATWTTLLKQDISIVACAAPAMGMTAACITACKVIERWRPRYLIMTGIAAGTKDEQKYGDILIAEAAYDYGSGKITDTESGDRIFTPSHNQLRIDADLHALLQRWERDQLKTDSIGRAWYSGEQPAPRLIIGLIASGAAVIQSKDLVEEILTKSRKVVGLDMEAYGIFHAAHLATSPRPKAIVVKSISDFADKRKDDKWQQYAAFTSARFIYEFFTGEASLQLGK